MIIQDMHLSKIGKGVLHQVERLAPVHQFCCRSRDVMKMDIFVNAFCSVRVVSKQQGTEIGKQNALFGKLIMLVINVRSVYTLVTQACLGETL